MKKMYRSIQFRQLFYCSLFGLAASIHACGQTNYSDMNSGKLSLTGEMVDHYTSIYEYILEVKLIKQQYNRVGNGLAQYWNTHNEVAIQQTLSDLAYFGKQDELEALRNSSQQVIVEAFRKDINDSVSKVWIEAFDAAHPDKMVTSGVKQFSDL